MEQLPRWFSESWINRTHNVLGFTLKPYSLNHLLYLYSIESPVLTFNPASTIRDLELACLICTTSFGDDIGGIIDAHAAENKKSSWRKKVHKALKTDETFLPRQFTLFANYIKDYSSFPETNETFDKDKKEEAPSVRIPWILNYITLLAMKFGWSEPEIMNLPVGKVIAFAHTITFLETGETKVLGPAEVMAIKLCRGEVTLDSLSI